MPEDSAGEKTEQPTARRREEARSSGQVPRSQDLSAAVGLTAGLLLLYLMSGSFMTNLMRIVREVGGDPILQAENLLGPAARIGSAVVSMLLPFLGFLLLFTALGTFVQFGICFTPKKLKPDLKNLSPMRGLKQIFSAQSLMRLGMGIVKMLVVAAIAWLTIVGEIDAVMNAAGLSVWGVLYAAGHLLHTLAMRLALVLLILGILDYLWQRYQNEQKLKMSKQEVKDEMKNMDGDPQIKRRQREAQMRVAMQRISQDVPGADVVVTNPTEYAVALKYDEHTMAAPRVIAKGKDLLALRIRQVAQQSGIPIVQRPPLARALYADVEVGREVPETLYKAVAEVLAYVYQISGRAARAG